MNANQVGPLRGDSFGNFAIATAVNVPLNTVSNTAAVMSVVGTSYIVRRVTFNNANASAATANVSIITSSDGNAANAVITTAKLSNVVSTTTYQDAAINANATSNVYSSGALWVKVTTANDATCDITVYGDIVNL